MVFQEGQTVFSKEEMDAMRKRSDYFEAELSKAEARAYGWRLAFICLLIFAVLLWIYSHHFVNPSGDSPFVPG
jgi:hypothetical protein